MTPATAWCAYCTQGRPAPFLHVNTVRDRQAPVRDKIGDFWRREGETLQQGWKRAYRAGWRVVKVKVIAV